MLVSVDVLLTCYGSDVEMCEERRRDGKMSTYPVSKTTHALPWRCVKRWRLVRERPVYDGMEGICVKPENGVADLGTLRVKVPEWAALVRVRDVRVR